MRLRPARAHAVARAASGARSTMIPAAWSKCATRNGARAARAAWSATTKARPVNSMQPRMSAALAGTLREAAVLGKRCGADEGHVDPHLVDARMGSDPAGRTGLDFAAEH